MKTCGVRCGAISKINPVILEFTGFKDNNVFDKKSNIKTKTRKNNGMLVKVEFNLECGNIRNCNRSYNR